ncbi:MAG: ThuA domain-containing protein [Bacteroidota bacterium]
MSWRNFFAMALIFCLALAPVYSFTQPTQVAEFVVHAGEYDRTNTPITVNADDLSLPQDTKGWQLLEHKNGEIHPVALQWDGRTSNTFNWILSGETPAGSCRYFSLQADDSQPSGAASEVEVTDQDGAVVFALGNREVLTYQYALAEVPEGVDDIYRRGGFIHPLRSLGGGTLTRIQPPDHYHHYGIWNPWTHTEYQRREIDFWNLIKGQGTVEAKGITSVASGEVFGKITAWHEHITYADSADKATAQKILNETWDLQVWNNNSGDPVYLVDFTTTQNNVTEHPFTVKEYRYQGFGFRANQDWDDNTAQLLTSEGKNKSDGNGTRARWGLVSGPTEAGTSGAVFMTHPSNYNFPEQIRIWPTGMNEGKENVFFNFNPAMDRDWVMPPKSSQTLRYRMLVYDGEIDSETANRYWQDFAYPPVVEVKASPGLEGKKLLLYTKNGEGYVHDNIAASVEAIRKLARENGFEVVPSEDPNQFTTENLKQYDALIFSNTNNDVFDTPEQEQAFQKYIQSGGRFVGIHSVCGSERDWDWFAQMLGGRFHRHPPSQDFDVLVLDKSHPSTHFLPDVWLQKDEECYYLKRLNPASHVLLVADLKTVEDEKRDEYPADYFGDQFPLAWCHEFDGGRQWYTALGHRPEHYSDPTFMRHILGGIIWVLSDEAP